MDKVTASFKFKTCPEGCCQVITAVNAITGKRQVFGYCHHAAIKDIKAGRIELISLTH